MSQLKKFLGQDYRSEQSALAQQRYRQIANGQAEAGLTGEQRIGTIRLLQLGANWG